MVIVRWVGYRNKNLIFDGLNSYFLPFSSVFASFSSDFVLKYSEIVVFWVSDLNNYNNSYSLGTKIRKCLYSGKIRFPI